MVFYVAYKFKVKTKSSVAYTFRQKQKYPIKDFFSWTGLA